MAWLQPADPTQPPQPEIVLTGQAPGRRAGLVGSSSSGSSTPSRSTRPSPWMPRGTRGLPAPWATRLRYDYDGDAGDTLRFGDGVFGAEPEPGATFTATYRSGGGLAGNVAADSITSVRSGRSPGGGGAPRHQPDAGHRRGRPRAAAKPSVAWHRRRSGPSSTGPSCRRTTRPPPRPSPGSSGPARSSDGRGAGSPSSRPPNPWRPNRRPSTSASN